jgi:hypothetical protein
LPGQEGALDVEREALLSLVRTKGLSIKYLDDQKKEQLRRLLDYLHNEKGLSLTDIAKMVGNKTSGYTSWLCRQLGVVARPFEEARLKGIREKRRKYERKPFDGTDEDKAYLLGLRHGDLSVSRPWNGVVRVSTSTTHPAMSELFHSLFELYGHVYHHPRYKKDTQSYEWNLSTIVDESFEFLLEARELTWEWVSKKKSTLLAYLTGLLDAEGSVVTTRNKRGGTLLFVSWNNSNLSLLNWMRERLREMDYPTSLCLNKKKGVRSKRYGIIHRQDYWQLSMSGIPRVQVFLRSIQIRHREKMGRTHIALSVRPGGRYEDVILSVTSLRAKIKEEVKWFVRKAEIEFLNKHPSVPLAGNNLATDQKR